MTHRKPKPTSHADTSTPEGRKETAAELRYVADLVDAGKLDIRKGTDTPSDDEGWDDVSFQRRLHSSLT